MTQFPGENLSWRKKTCHLTIWRFDTLIGHFFAQFSTRPSLNFVDPDSNVGQWLQRKNTGLDTPHTYISFRYPSLQQASWQPWAIWSCWSKKFLKKKTTSTNPKLWCPHSLQLEHKVGPSASEVGLAKFPGFLLFWNTLFTISEAGTLVCGLLKQLSSCWGHVGAPLEIQKMLQQNVLQKKQSISTVILR